MARNPCSVMRLSGEAGHIQIGGPRRSSGGSAAREPARGARRYNGALGGAPRCPRRPCSSLSFPFCSASRLRRRLSGAIPRRSRAAAPPAQGAAAVVFRNGDVYTMDSQRPWARGVAVRGNLIVAVSDTDVMPPGIVGAQTRIVDLGGRMLLPGFIDGHVALQPGRGAHRSTST
ncbi:MAG: hypothetical protein M0C28_23230 [Candidatus Moduliflexus flocculans]|nr:hypothetical protein [Candidatus Moduliflexus flocculans]